MLCNAADLVNCYAERTERVVSPKVVPSTRFVVRRGRCGKPAFKKVLFYRGCPTRDLLNIHTPLKMRKSEHYLSVAQASFFPNSRQ
jgi:hypothetical protein